MIAAAFHAFAGPFLVPGRSLVAANQAPSVAKSLLAGGAFQAEAIENADTLSIDGNDSGSAQFA